CAFSLSGRLRSRQIGDDRMRVRGLEFRLGIPGSKRGWTSKPSLENAATRSRGVEDDKAQGFLLAGRRGSGDGRERARLLPGQKSAYARKTGDGPEHEVRGPLRRFEPDRRHSGGG